MQRLFQNAKASLRLDVRFASSPVGSIDSRLPTPLDDKSGHTPKTDPMAKASEVRKETPSKNWRYSKAPGFLTGLDVDVREPFPDGSPQLPQMPPLDLHRYKVLATEPPSSGFNSPVLQENFDPNTRADPILSSPQAPESFRNRPQQDEHPSPAGDTCSNELEQPLTMLRLNDDQDMDADLMDESPIIAHLRRKSVDVEAHYGDSSSGSDERIVLSPSAKAAADSAKLKRGLFSDLFPKPPTHSRSSDGTSSSRNESQQTGKQCPDPLLHEGGPAIRCPDPTAHFASHLPSPTSHHVLASTPDECSIHQTAPKGFELPPGHFSRATATGSPMPLLKFKPPMHSVIGGRRLGPGYPPISTSFRSRPQTRHGQHLSSAYMATASEHFQPGWYYAKDSTRSSPRQGPTLYSFSTAAGKVTGHDPAPDSMIRDSYRTDTLTPLAKPPSRFRKNGISAIVSARSTGKHSNGPSYLSRPPRRRMQSTRSRLPDNMQFRSSPPRSSVDSFQQPLPRKRTRDLVSPTVDILEDETADKVGVDPRLRLEEGEDVIEVDEETSAAVRMSLFGTATPETLSEAGGGGMQELSPNVMLYRKGTRPSGSRKKRRPSYWDGDLEEVVRSPAARHVVSSPVKKDDVRSLQAHVEFEEEYGYKENQLKAVNDDLDNVSRVAEGPTVLQEDVKMEHQDDQYY
jgi:hypothetical protein